MCAASLSVRAYEVHEAAQLERYTRLRAADALRHLARRPRARQELAPGHQATRTWYSTGAPIRYQAHWNGSHARE
jgi:hypothetical protein